MFVLVVVVVVVEPVLVVMVVVVHGHDGHGLAKISLFSNAQHTSQITGTVVGDLKSCF